MFKLISVIRAAFGQISHDISLNAEDVQEIERIASRQSILYIAIVGITNLGYSELLTESMRNHVPKAIYDYVQRRESLNSVASALEEANIDYIPLKGSVIRDLYPQACMRTSSDIDVLVRKDSLEDAIAAIESKTDLKHFLYTNHDVQFQNRRLQLELHFSLKSNLEALDQVLDKAWEYSYPEQNGSRYLFTPEFQIFYIMAHAAKHLIKGGGIGIRPMLDFWLLRTKTQFDEAEVEKLCTQADLLKYYRACCRLTSVWFERREHDSVTREFEKLVISGGVLGSRHARIVAHSRKNNGAKYVLSRICLPSKKLQSMYPICEKHPILTPFYQVVRWSRLLNPSKRKEIRQELRQARKIDTDEIERYDYLLKNLGL